MRNLTHREKVTPTTNRSVTCRQPVVLAVTAVVRGDSETIDTNHNIAVSIDHCP